MKMKMLRATVVEGTVYHPGDEVEISSATLAALLIHTGKAISAGVPEVVAEEPPEQMEVPPPAPRRLRRKQRDEEE